MTPRWAPMFSWWIQDGVIQNLTWRKDELGRPAGKVAALMVYIAITIKAAADGNGPQKIKVTYNRLCEMTSISRELVNEGISILETLEMISIEKQGRNNLYTLINKREKGGWCKIPVKHVMTEDGKTIAPFKELKLRRRIELHAVKIFLYLASVRDNQTEFSLSSYETIRKAVAMSDKDIARALTLLTLIGLIARISSEKGENTKINQPNRYYLTGYKGFFK